MFVDAGKWRLAEEVTVVLHNQHIPIDLVADFGRKLEELECLLQFESLVSTCIPRTAELWGPAMGVRS